MDQGNLFDTRPQHPGKILKRILDEKGWTQDDLALVIGKSRQSVSEFVSCKTGITLDMAVVLAVAVGNSAQEWLKWDHLYRLSISEKDTSEVEIKARLYGLAPVRDMVKRGWIRQTDSATELQAELEAFFGPESLADGLSFPVATKRTVKLPKLNSAEIAWCFRARQMAGSLLCGDFSSNRLEKSSGTLRRLASHPKEARRLSKVLADLGVRLVIVEPLPDVRIDGATFWDDRGPVIALSMRHDRIDGFWFTVMHECSHVRNGDPLSVDTGMVDAVKGIIVPLADDEAEARANREAADSLIPSEEMDSFIRRVGPLYATDRIIQFANRLKIHPGIIVGQLQFRKELGYMNLRDCLVRIRDHVISTTLTDGWGQIVAPAALGVKI
ncbi:MAG: helix-turn-helix domain-containing protein [Bryobacteraceae bacterium]